MCLNSMSMSVCHYICYFGFVKEIKTFFFQMTIFGSVRFKQLYLLNPVKYFVQIFRIFRLIIYFEMTDERISKSYTFKKLYFPDQAY